MSDAKPENLCIAVRVYPEASRDEKDEKHAPRTWRIPKAYLVFDTETTVDETQRLTFGSYRYIIEGSCLEEGLFYGDDLPLEHKSVLERYVLSHSTAAGGRLKLLTRSEFADRLFTGVYKARCLLIGFNLPFDLSRIACDFTSARRNFAGGFSMGLWSYVDESQTQRSDPFRPRVCVKHINSKSALKGFTARRQPDEADLIPDGSVDGAPQKGYVFRGHMLDLRTLAFALTDRGHSLASAGEDFGVRNGKQEVHKHGVVTSEYIDYNRADVRATSELAMKLLEEYGKHPICLQATKAYSPASIGKAYLREMGITPVLERQNSFPKEYLGYAQSAFFGGRTSAHIRKIAVPVVYTDFLSMYPTVNSLMDLWKFVIAKEVVINNDCTEQIRLYLERLKPDDLFNPCTWRSMTAFVRIIPTGDTLPNRGKYSVASNDWQVAINNLFSSEPHTEQSGLWYSLPDVIASVLLTGRIPKIISAFRLEAKGTLPGLKSTKLRGVVDVNPEEQDFFRAAIEERRRSGSRTDLPQQEKARLDKTLKVTANAASYGIYAEMNREEIDRSHQTTCYGIDPEPFQCQVLHPDVPGEYCFPPLASLITGAARLMLSLLERTVNQLGGTYAMEDTDSMAIVATREGGVVPCPGGDHTCRDGREGVYALTWDQVGSIVRRFATLNPYDQTAVPGSILKIEDDNFDPDTKEQRQIYCFAISAKRYALFVRGETGIPALLRQRVNNNQDRWSKHGLGHLLNPTDPLSEDSEWIAHAWLNIVRRAEGRTTDPLPFLDVPAVGRTTVSSPAVMRAFRRLNAGKCYADQIKPFNFILTCQVKPLGHPSGTDPAQFHLIAPYSLDPREWRKRKWMDRYSGKSYRISTVDSEANSRTAAVKTIRDVLEEYEFHPEAKCADADGNTCTEQTVGLLQRRNVQIGQIKYLGKESNSLEDVDSAIITSPDEVYTEYPDPRRDEWQTVTLPKLKAMPLSDLITGTGLSRRALIDLRAGRSRPHPNNLRKITLCLSGTE